MNCARPDLWEAGPGNWLADPTCCVFVVFNPWPTLSTPLYSQPYDSFNFIYKTTRSGQLPALRK